MQFASIMDYVQALFGFFIIPLFGTVIIGMLWKRATPAGGFWGLFCGTLSSILLWLLVKFHPAGAGDSGLLFGRKGDGREPVPVHLVLAGVRAGDRFWSAWRPSQNRPSELQGLVYGLAIAAAGGDAVPILSPADLRGGGGGGCLRVFEFDFLVTRMSYSKKERMLRALRREPVDRLPTQINYTRAMGRLLCGHFGIAEMQLPERLGNHLLRVDIDYARRTNADGSIEFDWWGAGWDTRTEGYWHAFAPLEDSLDLDRYALARPQRCGDSQHG